MNKTLDSAIQQYVNKGFGSMNKNDFEVYIFNELLCSIYQSKNDYQISLELRIPISKVKRLRYEASLRYPRLVDYKALFMDAVFAGRFNEKDVVFSIEDVAVRQYLSNMLKMRGNFFDTSFNSEIVKINYKDFVLLLEDLCFNPAQRNKIDAQIRKNSDKDPQHLIFNAIRELVSKATSESVGELAKLGTDQLVKIFSNIK